MWSCKVFTLLFLIMLFPFVVSVAASPLSPGGEEYVAIWGSYAPDDSRESVHSYGIAMDAAGNVYVNDTENGRVRSYVFSDLPLAGESTLREISPAGVTGPVQITSLRSNEWTVGPGEDDDFATIQDAIGAAADGDTILIKKGIYKEHVVVNKALILDASYDAAIDGITLTADGCTLIGCMVFSGVWVESDNNVLNGVVTGWHFKGADRNWGGGFIVRGSHNTFIHCFVDGFYLGGGGIGMTMDLCSGNMVDRLSIIDSYEGIIIRGADNNVFRDCNICTRGDGVVLKDSDFNTFSDCSIHACDYTLSDAVTLLDSNRNIFTNCDLFGAQYGVHLCPNCEDDSFIQCTVRGGTADWYEIAFLVDEFPVEGGIIAVMTCGILGVLGVFMRKNGPK